MIKPLFQNILVKPEQSVSDKSKQLGIVIETNDKPVKGKVIALGEGYKMIDGSRLGFDVKVGDTVLYRPYAGEKTMDDDQEYLLISENDILGIYDLS